MNNITIFGHIGSDAKFRTTPTGSPVANFAVGVKDGRENTIWVDCALWGSRAEKLAPHLLRGRGVCVSGSIRLPEVWADNESGEPRARNSMFVNQVTFTSGAEPAESRTRAQDAPRTPEPVATHTDTPETDEIPF